LNIKKQIGLSRLRQYYLFFAPIPYRNGSRSYEEVEKMDMPDLSAYVLSRFSSHEDTKNAILNLLKRFQENPK